MTATPTDDQPGFVAEEPEHCHDCYRLILHGSAYVLTMEQLARCPDRIAAAGAIRLAGGRTVHVGEDRFRVGRGSAAAEDGGAEPSHVAKSPPWTVARSESEGVAAREGHYERFFDTIGI